MIRASHIWLVSCTLVACDAPDSKSLAVEPSMTDLRPITNECSNAVTDGIASAFVYCVADFLPDPSVSFGHDRMPSIVLGPPDGRGPGSGSEDVVSLGCGGSITLDMGPAGIRDGPGPDFAVFENVFVAGDTTFVEPALVLVSEDGQDWEAFDCVLNPDAGLPVGCAGLEPVPPHSDRAEATRPARAGGDQFDLAALGLDRARYIRVRDVVREYYGFDTWCAGPSGGFDLDAAAVLEPEP